MHLVPETNGTKKVYDKNFYHILRQKLLSYSVHISNKLINMSIVCNTNWGRLIFVEIMVEFGLQNLLFWEHYLLELNVLLFLLGSTVTPHIDNSKHKDVHIYV